MLPGILMLVGIILPVAAIMYIIMTRIIWSPTYSEIETAMSTALAMVEEPVRTYELYGHPAPPIPLLAASLPAPPLGYGWEITVEEGPVLRLALLNLATSTEVEHSDRDLVVVRRWRYANDDLYVDFYLRAGDPKTQGRVMTAHLINPLVAWATVLSINFTVQHPDETKYHYMLISNNERVSA